MGGLAADVDIFFEAASDPMLGLRFHRHFTHALAFIPIGGAVASLALLWRRSARTMARAILLATTIGYATHAPLDWLTSYGTVLGWPLTEKRFALDWMAIVDPIVTVGLALGLVAAVRRRAPRYARWTLLGLLAYAGLGGWQHQRAVDAVQQVAQTRGHEAVRVRVLPLVLSNLRWRGLYEADGQVFAVDVTVPWWAATRAQPGEQIELFRAEELAGELSDNACVEQALAQYLWFTDGWLARLPDNPSVLGDMRYSKSAGTFEPMWGLRFDATTEQCVELVAMRPTFGDVWRSLRR
jgi:inner membrane protein